MRFVASIIGGLGLVAGVAFADTKDDLPTIIQTVNTVLETYPTGKSLIWQNHQTGNYGEVTATSRADSNCRTYKRTWVFDDGVDTYEGKACLNDKGIWKTTSEQKTKREPLADHNDPLKIASRKAEEKRRQAEIEAERAERLRLAKIQAETEAAARAKAEEERLAAEALATKEAAEREAEFKKLEQAQLEAKRRLAEEEKQKQLAKIEAEKIAAEKEKTRLEAERIQQEREELEAAEARRKREEREKSLELAKAALGLMLFLGVVAAYFRSDWKRQREKFASLIKGNPDPKTMLRFLSEAKTLKREAGFDTLGSLCVLEERIEDALEKLTKQLSLGAPNLVSCTEMADSIRSDVSLYRMAGNQLSGQQLCRTNAANRGLVTKWRESVAQEVNAHADRLDKTLAPVPLATEIERLTPELDKRKQYLGSLPLDKHLDIFLDREEEASAFDEAASEPLSTLYEELRKTLAKTNLPDINMLADIPDDLARINQIKEIVDLYNDKINAVQKDGSLEAEDKEDSQEYLKRLRERDIAMLEGEM